jgi:nitroreductase
MSNTTLSASAALEQLKWRYATKKFDSAKLISDADWKTLEQSLVLAPSSFGLQPWKFFVVKNPDLRSQLLEHSWKQPQIVDASHLVVFGVKKGISEADVDRYIAKTSEIQGTPAEALAGFGGMIKGFVKNSGDVDVWSGKQLYIALGQFMTTAALMGIDTCALEGISPAKYDEILGIADQGYGTLVVCVAGYRSDDDKSAGRAKVRYATDDVVQYI